MVQDEKQQTQAGPDQLDLNSHHNARTLVRLFQCAQCSLPLRTPVTLPCGNSLCKTCMPSPHIRANITYPRNADRAEGFDCPFKDCGVEHSLADCSLDVTLNKVVEVVKARMALQAPAPAESPMQLDEKVDWHSMSDSNSDVMPQSQALNGGRIVSAFAMADVGELKYHSDVTFTSFDPGVEDVINTLDLEVTKTMAELARAELECHVCYGLMLDPLTTSCGHTFCRKCVVRVLDHSTICPACRRPMSLQPGALNEQSNKRVTEIIQNLLGDELAARILAVQEEESLSDDSWVSLFPVTLGYPGMPTFLHIFEPRYRLMIRRCVENGTRKFGLLMYNGRGLPQGHLGRTQFMEYGTMLHVQRVEVFTDGRSLIETHGLYRFRVLEYTMLDGYLIGRVQRVDDIPLAEEEAMEALETSGPEPTEEDSNARINHMSTQALLQRSLDFITAARARSAHWLHERVLAAYGQPPTDPALFPFWFASVLPMHDEAKYQLLPMTSVRERLKLTVRWITVLEESRWPDFGIKSPGQRILRVARPVEPELELESDVDDDEDEESDTSEPASLEIPDEPQATATEPTTANNNMNAETEEL